MESSLFPGKTHDRSLLFQGKELGVVVKTLKKDSHVDILAGLKGKGLGQPVPFVDQVEDLEVPDRGLAADDGHAGKEVIDLQGGLHFGNALLFQKVPAYAGEPLDVGRDPHALWQGDVHVQFLLYFIGKAVPFQDEAGELHGIVILHFEVHNGDPSDGRCAFFQPGQVAALGVLQRT